MARAAVLGDALAIAGRMRAIMTTEASGKVCVSEIVWISSPGNFQFGKNVAVVDCKNRLAGLMDVFRTACGEVHVVLLIKTSEGQRYLSRCFLLRGIVLFQQLQSLFLDEG